VENVEKVSVLLPLPLAGAYDYRADPDLALRPGDIVEVPLGKQTRLGVVLGPGEGDIEESRLRDVGSKREGVRLPEAVLELVRWVSDYTLAPPGAVLRMAMSVPKALEPPPMVRAYRLAPAFDATSIRMTPARERVLAIAGDGPPRTRADLAMEAGAGQSVVKGLWEAHALEEVLLPADPRIEKPDPDRLAPGLSPDQQEAADQLTAAVGNGFSVHLLDGVTGSGKTEVYHEAIAETLRQGKQVLVMLPEIALSAPSLDRFTRRFGAPPVPWHSDIGQHARRRNWRAVMEGDARVVVGARSALFLPYANLGLIIIDEEHDAAFKQEEGVIYNARDMAVVRARIGRIPIVLASATPSLETIANADAGRYHRHRLTARFGAAELPEVEIVDMRKEGPPDKRHWLSPKLTEALQATFDGEEQAALFINRRGYAPLTLCRTCGHRMQCPRCTAWLVEHRLTGRLQCHHCGYAARKPTHCPSCEDEDSLVACGPGVERLAEEAQGIWPEKKALLATSDTVHGPDGAAEMVRMVQDHEVDLLVGTQLIAKGHHFPKLTLVGVVDADLGLAGGDLRAAERTYQMLSQVAGRAGREDRPGRVLLQTYQPDHPVIRALATGDRDGFLAAESEGRRAGGMPPFGRLAGIIVSGKEFQDVERTARHLAGTAPRDEGIEVWGPAPAPLAVLRGRHRMRLLMRTDRRIDIQAALRAWMQASETPSSVRVQIDVDPYSFM
jgi:primosomal protein N' (replication factor Y)